MFNKIKLLVISMALASPLLLAQGAQAMPRPRF
jgi:hypothetical protein